jgi:hypothetical protein
MCMKLINILLFLHLFIFESAQLAITNTYYVVCMRADFTHVGLDGASYTCKSSGLRCNAQAWSTQRFNPLSYAHTSQQIPAPLASLTPFWVLNIGMQKIARLTWSAQSLDICTRRGQLHIYVINIFITQCILYRIAYRAVLCVLLFILRDSSK